MSSAPTPHVSRPGGVTLLVVLGLIQGVASLILGLVLILDKSDENLMNQSGMTENTLLGTGIGMMIVGAVMILLSLGLRNGSNFVRWLFGIVAMLNVAGGIWGIFALHGEQQLSSAFTAMFGLIILWILFGTERSDEFFAH
jgi:hypothetical protein